MKTLSSPTPPDAWCDGSPAQSYLAATDRKNTAGQGNLITENRILKLILATQFAPFKTPICQNVRGDGKLIRCGPAEPMQIRRLLSQEENRKYISRKGVVFLDNINKKPFSLVEMF